MDEQVRKPIRKKKRLPSSHQGPTPKGKERLGGGNLYNILLVIPSREVDSLPQASITLSNSYKSKLQNSTGSLGSSKDHSLVILSGYASSNPPSSCTGPHSSLPGMCIFG
ncbi:hypothetical protein AA313_de0210051 [Arthrobotrys entomopaga]|nr:hypothetical protein AA313_de0210051 [Arthrobotrys entomopaga]